MAKCHPASLGVLITGDTQLLSIITASPQMHDVACNVNTEHIYGVLIYIWCAWELSGYHGHDLEEVVVVKFQV